MVLPLLDFGRRGGCPSSPPESAARLEARVGVENSALKSAVREEN